MRKELKLTLLIVIVALIPLTIFDLQISELLYHPESRFGWFFESFGELVLSYIGMFSAWVLFRTQRERVLPFKILYGFLAVFNGFMAASRNKMYLNLSTVTMVLILVTYLVLFFFLAGLIKKEEEDLVRKIAKIGLLLSLLPIIIITLLKMIWGRQRYRSMVNPSAEFTPWYLIQGLTTDNEFMSFPSGHSANSSTVIWLTLLPLWLKSLRPYKTLLSIAAYLWLICVMISRVIMGAHFSTDVLVGTSITLIMFQLLKQYYLKDELI